ncbi:hypothetical protein F8M41_000085 [Gigaspora margarita]|uniref:Uncharacterized protein n=1 Tax=Gigaspora margarita TaxID=4874 RepID=A0A8H4EWF2_GIGMA|nr:hypothetical protein F8M41_000085 [Gigaspora margarita]
MNYTNSQKWSTGGSIRYGSSECQAHSTATLMPDGRIIYIGSLTHYNDLCTLRSVLKFGISNLDIANRPDPVNIEPRVGHTAVLAPDNYNAKLWISSATTRMPFCGEKGASHWWVRNSRSTTPIHRSNYKFVECNLYGKVALDMGQASVKRSLTHYNDLCTLRSVLKFGISNLDVCFRYCLINLVIEDCEQA